MTNTYIEKKLVPNYSVLMGLLKSALEQSPYNEAPNVSSKSLLALEAFSLTLSIQIRRDRVKRKYITKKFRASLEK